MELIEKKDDIWNTINSYRTDILNRDSIRDILESFAEISVSITNIYISNEEKYEDSFHVHYDTLDQFRSFKSFEDEYVDYVTFDCLIQNEKVSTSLSFNDNIISIFQKKKSTLDFLPFLNNMEEKIRLKKNHSLN